MTPTPTTKLYAGECLCGNVKIQVYMDPVFQSVCHCECCTRYHSSPLVGAFVFPDSKLLYKIEGEHHLSTYCYTETIIRRFCKGCGAPMFHTVPKFNVFVTFPRVLRTLPFKPSLHIYYEFRVMEIYDGLPKWKDMPEEFGGSGILMDDDGQVKESPSKPLQAITNTPPSDIKDRLEGESPKDESDLDTELFWAVQPELKK